MSRSTSQSDGAVELSVIIPMFNESARIAATLVDVTRALIDGTRVAELFLVDDGSLDQTIDVVRPWLTEVPKGNLQRVRLIRLLQNRGKGAAVRAGLAAAAGRWRLMMDADSSVRIGECERLWQHTGRGVAMVCGSRNAPESSVQARGFRRSAGLVFQLCLIILGLRLLRDTQCGFKLYRADVAEAVANQGLEDHLTFDLEHLLIAQQRGRIVEIGIRWVHCDGGSVRPVRDGLRMLAAALQLRWRLLRRRVFAHASGDAPALADWQVEIKPAAIGGARPMRAEPSSERATPGQLG